MKKTITLIIAFVAVSILCVQASATDPKKIYHWPSLKLTEYTSAKYIHHPNGDIEDRRAFYWGRVIGSDGLAFGIRNLLPHIVEGNWQEKVYNNTTERTFVFDKVKGFQDTYAAYGCGDNFMQFHAHPNIGQTVSQWRADVINGVTQKAELMAYAGVPRFLLDLEFASQDDVSTDPQFWYDLGGDVITAMRTRNVTFKFGFYPGLYGYWAYTLTAAERVNPRSIGIYPTETSIPDAKRNMRHALIEGIYDNLNGTTMWHFPGWTYSPSHMCAGTDIHSYVFNLESMLIGIIDSHTAMIGSGIEYMPAKWDFGRTQTVPIKTHWKQPNLSLNMMQRNYDLIYQYTDYAGVWDHGGWDDDGYYYLNYATQQAFEDDLAGLTIDDIELPDDTYTLASYYRWDSLTGETHLASVPENASMAEKLSYFDIYPGPGGYHVAGRHPANFPDYVDTMIVAAGKDQIIIPLRDSDEYSWANEYRTKGFFKNYEVVYTPGDPSQYGYLRPAQCPTDRISDLNKDCEVNILDFAMMLTNWMNCTHPNDINCD